MKTRVWVKNRDSDRLPPTHLLDLPQQGNLIGLRMKEEPKDSEMLNVMQLVSSKLFFKLCVCVHGGQKSVIPWSWNYRNL